MKCIAPTFDRYLKYEGRCADDALPKQRVCRYHLIPGLTSSPFLWGWVWRLTARLTT